MDGKSAALIVVDMNRAHLDIGLNYLPVAPEDSKRILQNVGGKVIPLFRKYRRPIIFVKTIHRVHPETGEPFSVMSPFWKFQMEKKAVSGDLFFPGFPLSQRFLWRILFYVFTLVGISINIVSYFFA